MTFFLSDIFNAGEIVPIVAIGAVFGIPIISMLVKHQQKMAEIMHGNFGGMAPMIDSLKAEVNELRQMVHQQAIAIDDLKSLQGRTGTPPTVPQDVRERLQQ